MSECWPEGLIQVYTGNGKGKTTAALGLALRASGGGFRVGFIQFMKGTLDCGEHKFVKRFPAFEIIQPAKTSYWDQPAADRLADARRALELSQHALASGKYDMVILDEIMSAFHYELLALDDVISLIKSKPAQLELVLTGRGAPPEVIELADLVTEMREIKHPYERGIPARRGVEF